MGPHLPMGECVVGGVDELGDLVDRIYEAAAVPEFWPDVMQDLSRLAGAAGAGLFVRREDEWYGWRISACLPDPADYLAQHSAKSLSTPRLLAAGHAGFLADHEAFTDEEYRSDPMITRWAVPGGLYHVAASAIQVPSGDLAVIQVMRRTGAPPFERESISRLDSLRPHLARAAMLSSRWRLERLRSTVQALDLLGLPAAVVSDLGQVQAANPSFEALGDLVFAAAHGKVRFARAESTQTLEANLQRLRSRDAPIAQSFAVDTLEGGSPAIAHLVPVRGEARDLFGGGMVLLLITPVGRRAEVDARLVQGLFDLTPAEAQVAAHLLGGRTVAEIAARNRVSVETVRAQVKAVLAKSGARRQAEFVGRFGTATLVPANGAPRPGRP